MQSSRIILIPLFDEKQVTTDGTALSKTTLDLDVSRVRNLLPHCEALFLIVNTAGVPASGVVEWNVAFRSGFDRNREQASSVDISSANFDVDGPKRSTDYTTTSNFLAHARVQAWWRNATGISGAKTLIVSAILGAKLYGV